jgi:MFS family permease
MSVLKKLPRKIQGLRSYDRSVKLFLIIPIFYGLYFAVKTLFFNFYILSLGFDKAYLGLANGITAAATLVFAFPLGVLTDRIGRKRSSLLGIALLAFSCLAFLLTGDKTLILVTLFISGVGDTLWMVASTPLLTRLTTPQNRVAVFSLRAAIFTFSGVVGNVLGGQMPSWLERTSNIQPGTIGSYRGILLISFGMLLVALIPIIMIPPGDGEATRQTVPETMGEKPNLWFDLKNILRKNIIWQLFLPNFLIGLGAALMVPYLNLFLVEKFSVSEQLLGTFFSIAALVTGTGTLFSPWIARRLDSRIRALVLTQGSSLFFLLLLGFSPWLGLAVIGFWGRNALMNMAQPLYNSFSMEQVADHEQGTLNSMLSMSWQIGWTVMPVFSGFIQENYGFSPIFITTSLLYALSTVLIWVYFKNSERSMANQITATLA